jgi:hypothetical protein
MSDLWEEAHMNDSLRREIARLRASNAALVAFAEAYLKRNRAFGSLSEDQLDTMADAAIAAAKER